MEDIRFSIIIPVYNTPNNLLRRCIDSVYRQKYPAYEVILIDDGSEKECAQTMDKISSEYENMTVYHIANGGVSNARNLGVEKARGSWIFFVDADDVVADCMLADAGEAICKYPDVEIVYGYTRDEKIFSSRQIEIKASNKMNKLSQLGIKKLLRHMISLEEPEYWKNEYYVGRGPWARAIKTALAHRFSFPLGIEVGEDEIWNIDILKTNPQAVVVNNIWYYYVQNSYSASKRFRTDLLVLGRRRLNKLNLVLGIDDEELHLGILKKTIDIMLGLIKGFYLHPEYQGSLSKANEEFKQIRKDEILAKYSKWKYLARLSWKKKLKWLILYKNPFPIYACKFLYLMRKH